MKEPVEELHPHLIGGRDQVDGLHAGKRLAALGDVFYNWRAREHNHQNSEVQLHLT